MRLLWVNVGGLWPLTTGGRHRSFNIIAELARRHEVVLLTTAGPGDDPEALTARLRHCETVRSVPYIPPRRGTVAFALALGRSWLSGRPLTVWRWQVPALREAAARVLRERRPDVVVADFLYSTPNVPSGDTCTVHFAHNVEHVIWRRLAEVERRPLRRAFLEAEWRRMRRYEKLVCQRASLTIAVSDVDVRSLTDCAPGARVAAIPTGVDTEYFVPSAEPETPSSLVFCGSMDWYPNEDGVVDFVDNVLPRVHRLVPDARLTIVGRNPGPRLRRLEGRSVEITGTVADVRPHVAGAAVFVVPLRVGGGTRMKIFEALAMGKAVVSTRVGAEGLPLVPGEHYLQADDPERFATAIVALLRDPARRQTMGRAGRRLVEERFSWPEVARAFEERIEEVGTVCA